jgi:Flp pilus assembly protein TadB
MSSAAPERRTSTLDRDERIRPSEVVSPPPLFDRFAGRSAALAGRAPFFAVCVLLVLAWLPTVMWLGLDTWQLTIQSITAIITFLLVALLQNGQKRSDAATQHKLDELADGLADVIESLPSTGNALREDVRELRASVGLEEREPS